MMEWIGIAVGLLFWSALGWRWISSYLHRLRGTLVVFANDHSQEPAANLVLDDFHSERTRLKWTKQFVGAGGSVRTLKLRQLFNGKLSLSKVPEPCVEVTIDYHGEPQRRQVLTPFAAVAFAPDFILEYQPAADPRSPASELLHPPAVLILWLLVEIGLVALLVWRLILYFVH